MGDTDDTPGPYDKYDGQEHGLKRGQRYGAEYFHSCKITKLPVFIPVKLLLLILKIKKYIFITVDTNHYRRGVFMKLGKALFTAGCAMLAGAGAVLAAPVVLPLLGAVGVLGAAGTGTAIASLSGAALASASGAAITGTVVGTTAVVGGVGAVAGGVAGKVAGDKLEKKKRS